MRQNVKYVNSSTTVQ